ncbi:MAG TPA: SufE family protein, partial [Opitutus sp.]|nr:SufE family protein [Opitutus sp.]
MTLNPRQQALLEEFLHFEDPQERLNAAVERARRIPKLSGEERSAAHRVPGCSSSVWLIPSLHEGRCRFRVGADSP